MNWKSTAVVSGATTLLATWLGWTTTPQPAAVVPAAPVRAVRPVGDGEIQEQARKLQTRVRTEVEFRDPTRNPFVFGTRKPTATRAVSSAATSAVAAAPLPAGPPPLALTLAGVATNPSDGTRTAIIDAPSGVLFVKEGDRVSGFTVAHVTELSVELVDADGATRTLTLRP